MRYWTKQHKSVYDTLMNSGRYTAKRDFVYKEVEDGADIMLKVYDWLTANHPLKAIRPADAECPIWLSVSHDTAMLPDKDRVIMELEIDPALVYGVNIAKWGCILNYGYIPKDEADKLRHRKLLSDYGTSDAKAMMTPFYPEIQREITESWQRLFDSGVSMGSDAYYGTTWELKKEWIIKAE